MGCILQVRCVRTQNDAVDISTSRYNKSMRSNTDGVHVRLILWKAERAMEAVDRRSIEKLGLGLSDFAVLEMLLHKGPQPVNTIGAKVLLTSGSITAAVDRLEARGLVRRGDHPTATQPPPLP